MKNENERQKLMHIVQFKLIETMLTQPRDQLKVKDSLEHQGAHFHAEYDDKIHIKAALVFNSRWTPCSQLLTTRLNMVYGGGLS